MMKVRTEEEIKAIEARQSKWHRPDPRLNKWHERIRSKSFRDMQASEKPLTHDEAERMIGYIEQRALTLLPYYANKEDSAPVSAINTLAGVHLLMLASYARNHMTIETLTYSMLHRMHKDLFNDPKMKPSYEIFWQQVADQYSDAAHIGALRSPIYMEEIAPTMARIAKTAKWKKFNREWPDEYLQDYSSCSPDLQKAILRIPNLKQCMDSMSALEKAEMDRIEDKNDMFSAIVVKRLNYEFGRALAYAVGADLPYQSAARG